MMVIVLAFAVAVFDDAVANGDASPSWQGVHALSVAPVGDVVHDGVAGGAAHLPGCTSHVQCSVFAAIAPAGRRAVPHLTVPVPIEGLQQPGGLMAVPHAKPPIV